MGWDQAAGLRQWANAESPDCPTHVAEMLVELADSAGGMMESSRTATRSPAKPAQTGAGVTPSRTAGNAQQVTLMVLGLPGTAERHTAKVTELLESWAREGRRWVGDPRAWRVVALPVNSPHLPLLVTQQSHWALWVDDDLEAFRRGYRMLKQIAEHGGPRRLLAVHPPGVGQQGLLANLQYVADAYFGIELLVLAR
ncbi:hypothetical protein [Billgrantia diversa]|uniref:hypothetical protein n=1 Tax=Halomonas sp. MCCC 1A13316 TaxID=2733487 RepID=UPI001E309623|nr:hypothetical protein [Halomonas sp. MCCC 1A13316]